jgi:HPr kinase/phosphorylase
VTRTLTARDLFDELQERLDLQWVAGRDHGEDARLSENDMSSRPALAGYLNLIHPNRVQVLGAEELVYLAAMDDGERTRTLAEIFDDQLIAVVVGSGLKVPEELAAAAEAAAKPLLKSGKSSYDLVNYLQYHIARVLARRCNLHGVFMEIFTIGVLITGSAGSGKSELALELLNRGHRLIADDAPEFTLISPEVIDGSCPEALQDCLEVRGLGVLNIREMFGDAAIKLNKFLRLIVHLDVPAGGRAPETIDRLRGDTREQEVLGLSVPTITLPVLAGRNMAVITEAAVRDFMLRMKGFDAATAFLERHSRLLRGPRQGLEP